MLAGGEGFEPPLVESESAVDRGRGPGAGVEALHPVTESQIVSILKEANASVMVCAIYTTP